MTSRLLAIAAVIAAAGVGTASAADLSPRMYTKAPSAIVQVYSWTGWYAGINGGYSWRDPSIDFTAANAATAAFVAGAPAGRLPMSVGVDPKGALIGGTFGYNWQSGAWIVGVETDLDWADISGSGSSSGVPFTLRIPDQFTATGTQRIDAFGTLRARLGFTPMDRVMLYATGGLAYGHAKLDTTFGDVACNTLCGTGSTDKWKVGWTAGAGVEWAFLNNWSLKGEYLYYDLGSIDEAVTDPINAPGAAFNAHADYRGNIVRLGVNYKFGGPFIP